LFLWGIGINLAANFRLQRREGICAEKVEGIKSSRKVNYMNPITYLLALTLIVVTACQQGSDAAQESKSGGVSRDTIQSPMPAAVESKQAPLTFVDSVAGKFGLTIQQVKVHTQIPEIYYTDIYSGATFEGEKVIDLAYGYKGAILNYSDGRNCMYKFLLIMDTANNKNGSYSIIYSECDRDESAGYKTINYKFLNDSLFDITETYLPPHAGENDPGKRVTVMHYRVSRKGMIESFDKGSQYN
jgi:hypothetical protein